MYLVPALSLYLSHYSVCFLAAVMWLVLFYHALPPWCSASPLAWKPCSQLTVGWNHEPKKILLPLSCFSQILVTVMKKQTHLHLFNTYSLTVAHKPSDKHCCDGVNRLREPNKEILSNWKNLCFGFRWCGIRAQLGWVTKSPVFGSPLPGAVL
jgi:hypothetical protein